MVVCAFQVCAAQEAAVKTRVLRASAIANAISGRGYTTSCRGIEIRAADWQYF